jgi:hypothetical protein
MDVEPGGPVPKPDNKGKVDFDGLCQEAVRACGDDWHKIENYVTGRLSRMPPEERDAVLNGVSKILCYEPPRR